MPEEFFFGFTKMTLQLDNLLFCSLEFISQLTGLLVIIKVDLSVD